MKSKFYSYVISVLLLLPTATTLAQNEESLMTYVLATSAMDAAEAYAREQGWNVTILITDQNNNPVMLRRIDGAGGRTFNFATAKALVVNETGLTSGEYGRRVQAYGRNRGWSHIRRWSSCLPHRSTNRSHFNQRR